MVETLVKQAGENEAGNGDSLDAVPTTAFTGTMSAASRDGSVEQRAPLVKFSCGVCGARYALPETRVHSRVLTIRCKSCGDLFQIQDRWSAPSSSVLARGEKCWFVAVAKQHVGPMTAQDVRERWARGELTGRTYGWRQGMSKWIRLRDLTEFADTLSGASRQEADGLREAVPERVDDSGQATIPRQEAEITQVTVVSNRRPDQHWSAGLTTTQPVSAEVSTPGTSRDELREPGQTGPLPAVRAADTRRPAQTGPFPALDDAEPPTVRVAAPQPAKRTPAVMSEHTAVYPPGYEEAAANATREDRRKQSAADLVDSAEASGGASASADERVEASDQQDSELGDREQPTISGVLMNRPDQPDLADAEDESDHALLAQRNEDSVLFSLDHLIADVPTASWLVVRKRPIEDEMVIDERGQAVVVPPPSVLVNAAEQHRKHEDRLGAGGMLLASAVGAMVGAAALLASLQILRNENRNDLFQMLPASAAYAASHGVNTQGDGQRPGSASDPRDRLLPGVLAVPAPLDDADEATRPARHSAVSPRRSVRPSWTPRRAAKRSRKGTARRGQRSDGAARARQVAANEAAAPAHLTQAQVAAALAPARSRLRSCREEYGQPVAITLSLLVDGNSGSIKRCRVLPEFLDEGLTDCVHRAVASNARFPFFEGSVTITRPVFLR